MDLKRILIVEDDVLLLKTISVILKKNGFATTETANGKQALEAIKTTDFDLVLTDLMLPYANGFEIINNIKKESDHRVPVVIISSAHTEETVLDGFDIGADDYLRKPFTPGELLSRINRLL
ncbi:MAG: response regulator transcription factor [Pseudosphingobacterium sp.]|nr:response regulator transcription factor [Olivibacter sp. UJ_SKK_5.1]MDX3912900.1 response regulator transcription factor [Pseudosphingobacterium sp.]